MLYKAIMELIAQQLKWNKAFKKRLEKLKIINLIISKAIKGITNTLVPNSESPIKRDSSNKGIDAIIKKLS